MNERRLSLAVLSVGAALVLAAGGAWWVAADPDRQVEPVRTTPPDVVPEPVAPEPVDNGPESYLPDFPNTVERQVGRLDGDGTYVLRVPSQRNGEYRLQYVCLGPGDLSVQINGTTEGEMLYEVDCEGNLSTFQFVAAGTDVVVEVHRPGSEPADVGVQVIYVE